MKIIPEHVAFCGVPQFIYQMFTGHLLSGLEYSIQVFTIINEKKDIWCIKCEFFSVLWIFFFFF